MKNFDYETETTDRNLSASEQAQPRTGLRNESANCHYTWRSAPRQKGNPSQSERCSGALLRVIVSFCLLAIPIVRAAETADKQPVTLVANDEWIPLRPALDIVPGSALDWSTFGFQDAPAGKHGRVIACADGTFAFEDSPEIPRRFYGVNFCFGAQYLPHREADRLADRLVQLGYNAVRIHHYERDLVSGAENSVTLNPEKLDQLDFLLAAFIKRGLYLTTDLFVSRPVPYREIGVDRPGNVPMDTFKIMVPVHEGAWENWKAFSRAFLQHVNPYTQRNYAEEPALAWLCLINEGNFGNFFSQLKEMAEWQTAWNRWLSEHYGDRAQLARVWQTDLTNDEDPSLGTVRFPDRLDGAGLRRRDCIAFLSAQEALMVDRMRRFLLEELNCKALISNANSWTYYATDQATRATYDYVDDHFYVDHPRFIEQSWRLPSRCPNTSPVAEGATGGRSKAFTRLYDKPFTITEYNYSGPGRYRGVGGILTGALGALQGWAGIWRFAYSHSRDAMFQPTRINYFDLAADPLSQAAERASLCLFLRGDLRVANHQSGFVMTTEDLKHPAERIPRLAPDWHWLAWITRLGTLVVDDPKSVPPDSLLMALDWQTPRSAYPEQSVVPGNPYATSDEVLLNRLRARGVIGPDNPTDPGKKIYQSETEEITIDGERDILILDTTRTAGGYAKAGELFTTRKGGVTIHIYDTPATVWVSALDDQPISRSQRLLVTHCTDLQNTNIRYAEAERQTLLDWGSLPHLVRAGRAGLSIQVEAPERCRVWALNQDGSRGPQLPTTVKDQRLEFTVDVAADKEGGARMLYEIAR